MSALNSTLYSQALQDQNLTLHGVWDNLWIENCIGRSLIEKKLCNLNYLIWNQVFLPQMCQILVSYADFEAISIPFRRSDSDLK